MNSTKDELRAKLQVIVYHHTKDEVIDKLADFVAERERLARVDELYRVDSHNNSLYTSDYIETRLSALQPSNKDKG